MWSMWQVNKQHIFSPNENLVYVSCKHLLIIHSGPLLFSGTASFATHALLLYLGDSAGQIHVSPRDFRQTRASCPLSAGVLLCSMFLLWSSPTWLRFPPRCPWIIWKGWQVRSCLWISFFFNQGLLQPQSVKELQRNIGNKFTSHKRWHRVFYTLIDISNNG